MAETVNVNSIEAIRTFREALCNFIDDARNALGAADMEVHRNLDWLQVKQKAHWQGEIKRRREQMSEERTELHRKKLASHDGTDRATEQKEIVRESKRKLDLAEQKLEKLRRWTPIVQHAVFEYQAHGRALGDNLSGALQAALEKLERMAASLDAYVAMSAPSTPRPADGGKGG